jgi:Domain of unknown function (DUF4145)
MPVPEDFDCDPYFQGNKLHSVNDVRAICPYCENASTFTVRSFVYKASSNGQGGEIRLIIECNYAPCHQHSFVLLKTSVGAHSQTVPDFFYMYPSRGVAPRHSAIPIEIAEDWEEAQKAMATGAVKATAVMCRRVFYGVLLNKKCKLHPLHDGVKQLISENRLPAMFDAWLPAIRDDGHDAAHPDRALKVSTDNIIETMAYTAELLKVLYIAPWEFLKRQERIAADKAAQAK